MTDASSLDRSSPQLTAAADVCRYFIMSKCVKGDNCQCARSTSTRPEDILTKAFDEREQDDGLHIQDSDPGQSSDADQAEVVHHGVSQGQVSSPVGENDQFIDIRTLGFDTSREALDNSWNQGFSVLCSGSTNETAVGLKPEDWAMAHEFVPGQKWKSLSFAETPSGEPSTALQHGGDDGSVAENEDAFGGIPKTCPELLENDVYESQDLHPMLDGQASEELCDLCQDVVLSALTDEERQKHITECIENHEKEMERSFAIQRSQEKSCGICMDVVWEKAIISEQRFGILSNCSHVFCLTCIRKWRSAKQFENKIVRACPECRVKSDFVTPSRYWMEDKEDKKRLIEEYKLALSKKPCKYFDKGRGECPFNEKCFYLHALPDGRVASPKPVHHRRRPPAALDAESMVLYEILDDWPLNHWEDLIFHLNFFELSLLSTSDEEDEDGEDDFDEEDMHGVV